MFQSFEACGTMAGRKYFDWPIPVLDIYLLRRLTLWKLDVPSVIFVDRGGVPAVLGPHHHCHLRPSHKLAHELVLAH
jgi:hypothetical protein